MFAAQRIPYQHTGAFSKIVLDYLEGVPSLDTFYENRPTSEGIQKAIEQKQQQNIDRGSLVAVLKEQYASSYAEKAMDNVLANIELLSKRTTFTICTAHQPNLFTGPLYFIYKILHAIKLSEELKAQHPHFDFVPVYYMGSEDADLAELNHFHVEGKKYEWATKQTGAVGRMRVDKALLLLIDELEGQLSIHPHGSEWTNLLKQYFTIGTTIQLATFGLVHHLFAAYGLVVLIADHTLLKKSMRDVFEEDLFKHTSSSIVTATSTRLNEVYPTQAHSRDINLFYLHDGIRERIEKKSEDFVVCNTSITFSAAAIKDELQNHPERFSPNVILRGLYQETILPNIVFIGGGGEVAYWLQLKDLFQYYNVPYPALVLRNSFVVVEQKWQERIVKLNSDILSFFQASETILNTIVQRNTTRQLTLNGKLEKADALYDTILDQAQTIDPTLAQHVAAIKKQALHKLKEVEKKMLRAEKRRFKDQQQQIEAIRKSLFPRDGLQERVDNICFYYAKWGSGFIDILLKQSLGLEQQFTVLNQAP